MAGFASFEKMLDEFYRLDGFYGRVPLAVPISGPVWGAPDQPGSDAAVAEHCPHPLDADGKPIVVGAFYVGSTCGPCLSVHLNGSVVIGAMRLNYTRQLRRAVATVIRCVSSHFGVRTYEVASSTHSWSGRLTDEQASAVINEADRCARWRAELVRQAIQDDPPIAPPKPIVRCGQRWRLDGVEVELYDNDTLGVYKARNWDGVRVKVRAADLKERGVFLSGPTEHETHAEAVRRVVDIEAANPPEGIGREEWRAMLINRIGDGIRNTGSVRMVAADARAEVAEKWRKFGGGR